MLSLLPCKDKAGASPLQQATISAVTAEHHSYSNHQQEGCTPFCACVCCHVVTDASVKTYQLAVQTSFTEELNVYPHFHIKEIAIPFWQPPKI